MSFTAIGGQMLSENRRLSDSPTRVSSVSSVSLWLIYYLPPAALETQSTQREKKAIRIAAEIDGNSNGFHRLRRSDAVRESASQRFSDKGCLCVLCGE